MTSEISLSRKTAYLHPVGRCANFVFYVRCSAVIGSKGKSFGCIILILWMSILNYFFSELREKAVLVHLPAATYLGLPAATHLGLQD